MALGRYVRYGRLWMRKAKRTPGSIFGYVKVSRRKTAASTSEAGPGGTTAGIVGLEEWARSRHLDAVVWTALPPQLKTAKGCVPTEDEVMGYVRGLTGARRSHAEQYVRRTPRQIDTVFRRRMEAEFNLV